MIAAYLAASVLLGALSSFLEIFSKFRNDFANVITCKYALIFLGANATISGLAFIALYLEPTLSWGPWTKVFVAGPGFQTVMRLKLSTVEFKGESYGLGTDGVYKLIQDLFMSQIDQYLITLRRGIIHSLISLPVDDLKGEVDVLIGSSRLLNRSEERQKITQKLSSLPDDTAQKSFLAEYLIDVGNMNTCMNFLASKNIKIA